MPTCCRCVWVRGCIGTAASSGGAEAMKHEQGLKQGQAHALRWEVVEGWARFIRDGTRAGEGGTCGQGSGVHKEQRHSDSPRGLGHELAGLGSKGRRPDQHTRDFTQLGRSAAPRQLG